MLYVNYFTIKLKKYHKLIIWWVKQYFDLSQNLYLSGVNREVLLH